MPTPAGHVCKVRFKMQRVNCKLPCGLETNPGIKALPRKHIYIYIYIHICYRQNHLSSSRRSLCSCRLWWGPYRFTAFLHMSCTTLALHSGIKTQEHPTCQVDRSARQWQHLSTNAVREVHLSLVCEIHVRSSNFLVRV